MGRYTQAFDQPLPKAPLNRLAWPAVVWLAHYWRAHKKTVLTGGLALIISTGFGLAFPALAGLLIDAGTQTGRPDLIISIVIKLFLALALQASFSFLQTLQFNRAGERAVASLRSDIFDRLVRLPMSFFAKRRVGELANRLAADLAQIQDTLIITVPHISRQLLLLLGSLALLMTTSLYLTALMLACVPLAVIAAKLFGTKIRAQSREAQDSLAQTATVVEEVLQSIPTVKAFGNERYESRRYKTELDRFVQIVIRGARYRAGFISFLIFVLFGAIVVVLGYGANLMQHGAMSVGQLTQFLLYTMFVAGALASLGEGYAQLQRTIGATQRIQELANETPESIAAAATPNPKPLEPEVIFENVSFAYPNRPTASVLQNISLHIKAGETLALVGPSGAGKSTLMNLLLRFYDPTSGKIFLGNTPLEGLPLETVRAQFAIVPQEPMLFGGTITENIAYGRPEASPNQIEQAAKSANVDEFALKLPEQYNTLLGERGLQLSGGQRQRIALARALLKNAPILILDEATSALDAENERLIQEAIGRIRQERTVIVIAHRLSTIRSADRIAVLQHGKIVDIGSHAELMNKSDGIYAKLVSLQLEV